MLEEQTQEPKENKGHTQRELDSAQNASEVSEEYKRRINSYEEMRRRYERG